MLQPAILERAREGMRGVSIHGWGRDGLVGVWEPIVWVVWVLITFVVLVGEVG